MHVFHAPICVIKLIIERLGENKWLLQSVSSTFRSAAHARSWDRKSLWPQSCRCCYRFWIVLRSCSRVFLSGIAHAQTSETCGGCMDIQNELQMSVPTLRRRPRLWPPSTIHKLHSSTSRYEVIPAQVCRRERQILLICTKTITDYIFRNLAESLGERKNNNLIQQ